MNTVKVSATLDRWYADMEAAKTRAERSDILADFVKLCRVYGLDWEGEQSRRHTAFLRALPARELLSRRVG